MRKSIVFVLCLLCPMPIFAQATEGSILGTVTDSTGAAVPQAVIHIRNIGTGAETGKLDVPRPALQASDGAEIRPAGRFDF